MDKAALRRRLITQRLHLPDRLQRADRLQQVLRIWLLNRPERVIDLAAQRGREHVPEALRLEGPSIKYDISVSVLRIPDFIAAADMAGTDAGHPGGLLRACRRRQPALQPEQARA